MHQESRKANVVVQAVLYRAVLERDGSVRSCASCGPRMHRGHHHLGGVGGVPVGRARPRAAHCQVAAAFNGERAEAVRGSAWGQREKRRGLHTLRQHASAPAAQPPLNSQHDGEGRRAKGGLGLGGARREPASLGVGRPALPCSGALAVDKHCRKEDGAGGESRKVGVLEASRRR